MQVGGQDGHKTSSYTESTTTKLNKYTLLGILNEDMIKDYLLLEASASHVNYSRVQQACTICRNKECLLKFYSLNITLWPAYIQVNNFLLLCQVTYKLFENILIVLYKFFLWCCCVENLQFKVISFYNHNHFTGYIINAPEPKTAWYIWQD